MDQKYNYFSVKVKFDKVLGKYFYFILGDGIFF